MDGANGASGIGYLRSKEAGNNDGSLLTGTKSTNTTHDIVKVRVTHTSVVQRVVQSEGILNIGSRYTSGGDDTCGDVSVNLKAGE